MSTLHFRFLIGFRLGARPPGRSVKKTVRLTFFFAAFSKTGQFIGRPGGNRISCFFAIAPKCKGASFVIDGVRCQPSRSKKTTCWDDLI